MCSFHSQPYSDLHRFNKITKNRKWTNVSCHLHVHFFFMTYIRFSHMQTDALLLCLNKATFLQEFFFLTHSVSLDEEVTFKKTGLILDIILQTGTFDLQMYQRQTHCAHLQ